MLHAVGLDPAKLRGIALAVQHVFKRKRLVLCRIAREAVHVIARSVREKRGKGQRSLFDELRHDAGDVRVEVDLALVGKAQQRDRKHGF